LRRWESNRDPQAKHYYLAGRFWHWTKSLNIQTTFVYTHYTLVHVSFILNNITLITIVILVVFFYRNTNNYATSRYCRICRYYSDIWRSSMTHIDEPCTCLTPLCGWTPCDINITYTLLKSAFNGLQFRRWQYGCISISLAVIASETREMSRNLKRIWPYSSSRSSKVIDLGVNGKPIYDFILVINSKFSRICYCFRDIHG